MERLYSMYSKSKANHILLLTSGASKIAANTTKKKLNLSFVRNATVKKCTTQCIIGALETSTAKLKIISNKTRSYLLEIIVSFQIAVSLKNNLNTQIYRQKSYKNMQSNFFFTLPGS